MCVSSLSSMNLQLLFIYSKLLNYVQELQTSGKAVLE